MYPPSVSKTKDLPNHLKQLLSRITPKRPQIVLLLIVLLTGLISLSQCHKESDGNSKDTIVVAIPPLRYFLQQLVENDLQIDVLLPPGSNPTTFEPGMEQLKSLSNSELYFMAGLPFEMAWMSRIRANNENLKIIELNPGRPNTTENVSNSQNHNHQDPHFWLSISVMQGLIPIISNALLTQYPQLKAKLPARQKKLSQKLIQLDQQIRTVLKLANQNNRHFVVYHPSWDYFARDYNLHMHAIESAGQEAQIKRMLFTGQLIQKHGIQTIIVQPEFDHRSARTLANEQKLNIVAISPMAENWDQNLLCLAQAIVNQQCR